MQYRHPTPERVRCLKLEPSRSYPVRYGWTLLRHMASRTPLRLEDRGACVETDFTIPEDRYSRWHDVFAGDDFVARSLLAAGPSPLFSYHSAADTFALFALARRLGIPFKNILHASTSTQRRGVLAAGRPYTALCTYLGAEPRRSRGALLRFRTEICDGLDDPVIDAENALFVRDIPAEHWERLETRQRPTTVRRNAQQLHAPEWSDSHVVSDGMSRSFGLLSGDLNPLHTSRRIARWLGHRTGFIQGMCAYNLTVAALRKRTRKPLAQLQMSFSRPFYIGMAVTLNVEDGQFEWVDENAKVLGYGTFSTTPSFVPYAPLRARSATRTMRPSRRRIPTLNTRPTFAT